MPRNLACCLIAVVLCHARDGAAADQAETFDRTIAPLLARRCLDCHSGAAPKGGLNLTARKNLLTGGDSGPPIVPGKPDNSLLWQRVRDNEMPPKKS